MRGRPDTRRAATTLFWPFIINLRIAGSTAVLRKFIGEHISVGPGSVARKTIFMVQPDQTGVAITSVCSGRR